MAIKQLTTARAKYGTPEYRIQETMDLYGLDWEQISAILDTLGAWFLGITGMEKKDPGNLKSILEIPKLLNRWDTYGPGFKSDISARYRVCTVKIPKTPLVAGKSYTLKTGPKTLQSYTLKTAAADKFYKQFYKGGELKKGNAIVLIQGVDYGPSRLLFTQYQCQSFCTDLIAYRKTPKDVKDLAKFVLRHIDKYSWMLQTVWYIPKKQEVRIVKVYET